MLDKEIQQGKVKTTKILTMGAGVILFALVVSFCLMPGGFALGGKVSSGHYYLGSHGHYREVSRNIFVLSALLGIGIGFMLPVYAIVFTMWRESVKPSGNRRIWLRLFAISLAGLMLLFMSIRCLMW
ncbi:MAG TPA: hypothetical protein VGN23_10695 [Verrucomicrobiae bacterium]